ncbi:MAG: sialate O-acetylesterase, partial [Candidatus Flemingiibacterium sp.]
GMLYHFMLERLMPFSFGRVVWYQGESNSSVYEGEIYDKLLDMMIGNWRKSFADEKLGFIIVQIADFIHTGDKNGWQAVQDAQLRAQDEIPGVRTVVSADICENDMIHPVTKWKLAKRISEIY